MMLEQSSLHYRADCLIRTDATCCHVGIQVCQAFHFSQTGDTEKNHAVKPIIGFAVGRVDRHRDKIMFLAQPTIKSETCLDHVSAPGRPNLDAPLFGVRAVNIDPVAAANHESTDRMLDVPVKDEPHAKIYRLSGLDEFDWLLIRVE